MAAPRNDQRANAMFEAYRGGASLASVAKAFGCSRQSVYVMFKRRNFALRERPAPLPFVLFEGRRYTLRGDYYASTAGERDYLHRDMWKAAHGAIPNGLEVHHKNGDRFDNRISNFQLLTKSEHARKHKNEKR